jgi:hypothetical protein
MLIRAALALFLCVVGMSATAQSSVRDIVLHIAHRCGGEPDQRCGHAEPFAHKTAADRRIAAGAQGYVGR